MTHDLWQVINDVQVEAWGSTKDDDRKGELNPGDVIDILDAYPSGDPEWLQFEIYSGGADLEPHSKSPYNEYWVKRAEIKLARPGTEPEEPPTEPEEPSGFIAWLVSLLRAIADFLEGKML